MEKQERQLEANAIGLLPTAPVHKVDKQLTPLVIVVRLVLAAATVLFVLDVFTRRNSVQCSHAMCIQPPPLAAPENATLDAFRDLVLYDPEYLKKSVELYSGAVKIPTESFDDNGEIGEDPRWDIFPSFHAYLAKSFPLVHKHLVLEKVNTLGLLYTWKGTESSLKPIILMAHYDVVPVNEATLSEWSHPPYSGHYDGTYVWGRGSSDTKSLLISHLEAVEGLLSVGFAPTRTVLLSYGFDEESMLEVGRGASYLSAHIESIYGKDSIELLVDEGGGARQEMWGRAFFLPGMGEKGYVDINVTLTTPGGHSSVPPKHTGIGILSSFITHLEETPYPPYLAKESPFFGVLECIAQHAHDVDEDLVRNVKKGDELARAKLADLAVEMAKEPMVVTTQAVDIIKGGVKVNALPELTYVVINHRISIEQNVDTVKKRLTELANQTATQFGLDLDAFGTVFSTSGTKGRKGELQLVATKPLNPAPSTPRDANNTAWNVMAGTINHVYTSKGDEEVIVGPGMTTGNTDTRFYWSLTKNIYRFSPIRGYNAHTVDEHSTMQDHLEAVVFFHTLIRNMDAAR